MDPFATDEFDDEGRSCDESESTKPRFVDLRSKEAEEFNRLLDLHLPDQVLQWNCEEDIGWTFELEDIVLDVENTRSNKINVGVTSGSMPRVNLDPLRIELRQLISTGLANQSGVLEFAIILLQLVEEAVIHIHEWKNWGKTEAMVQGWNVNEIRGLQPLLSNPFGANLETVDDSAGHILGKPVKDICEDISNEYIRIVHVEPVIRNDLARRFFQRQREMMDQLRKCSYQELRACISKENLPRNSQDCVLDNREDLARELCRPRITFHGTSRWNVSSIVRHGFVIPGQNAGERQVEEQFGASFGRGIYTSPDAEFALAYSHFSDGASSYVKARPSELPGLRLIICAVLMGRPIQVTREATRRTEEIADKRANSHVSPNLLEYVVFDAAQVIPCYVVHIDFGVEAAQAWLRMAPANPANFNQRKKMHAKLNTTYLFPAEVDALKQARKAAALKWFPYGFGPATGTKFVIEEIGEVSDDEEIYGEYQGQRQEVGSEVIEWEDTTDANVSWFDEYQTSRREVGKVKKKDGSHEDDDDDD